MKSSRSGVPNTKRDESMLPLTVVIAISWQAHSRHFDQGFHSCFVCLFSDRSSSVVDILGAVVAFSVAPARMEPHLVLDHKHPQLVGFAMTRTRAPTPVRVDQDCHPMLSRTR